MNLLYALLRDSHVSLGLALVFSDNVTAVYLAINPTFCEGSKHREIYCHFMREKVNNGPLRLVPIKSAHQLAALFTKLVTGSLCLELYFPGWDCLTSIFLLQEKY